jgi:hypothetical protein
VEQNCIEFEKSFDWLKLEVCHMNYLLERESLNNTQQKPGISTVGDPAPVPEVIAGGSRCCSCYFSSYHWYVSCAFSASRGGVLMRVLACSRQ